MSLDDLKKIDEQQDLILEQQKRIADQLTKKPLN